MWTRTRVALVAGLLLATAPALAGCSGTTEPADPPATEGVAEDLETGTDTTDTATSEPELPDELQRTWALTLTQEQIADDLRTAGYARWLRRFFVQEGLVDPQPMAMEFDGSEFTIYFLEKDGSWKAAWYGTAEVRGRTVALHDDFFAGVVDSFRWRVDGSELTMTWFKSTTRQVRGLPSGSYGAAYFSRPWHDGNCSRFDLDSCT